MATKRNGEDLLTVAKVIVQFCRYLDLTFNLYFIIAIQLQSHLMLCGDVAQDGGQAKPNGSTSIGICRIGEVSDLA